ncbi:putative bifunctional diguanylate cyclase/phosphodiesterase [Marinobacterium jannaschii]|uniref:putative bifunctional diguanylate cyclase/phosphodiesterase n=1 Tax=Marinobacterium jannaschii TaxID=64970 RepID=UPI00048195A2|nr:GGDEF domain-containing phosphodiesterase [Marinobacterium jannaschii]
MDLVAWMLEYVSPFVLWIWLGAALLGALYWLRPGRTSGLAFFSATARENTRSSPEATLHLRNGVIVEASHTSRRGYGLKTNAIFAEAVEAIDREAVLRALSGYRDFRLSCRLKGHASALMLVGRYSQFGNVMAFDITLRSVAELDSNPRYQRLKNALSGVSESAVVTDLALNIKAVNPEFERVSGYRKSELLGQHISIIGSGYHNSGFYHEMWQQLQAVGQWSGQVWNRNRRGETYLEQLAISEVVDARGEVSHYLGLCSDVSDSKLIGRDASLLEVSRNLKFLPAIKDLEVMLASVSAGGYEADLVLIDLQRYLLLKETLGADSADQAVEMMAQRISAEMGAELLIHRIDWDKFAFLIRTDSLRRGQQQVERIISCLDRPVRVLDKEIGLTANFGISTFPEDGVSISRLINSAETAVQRARQYGTNTCIKYDARDTEKVVRVARYERGLKGAVDAGELELHYQPIVDVDGRVSKLEALLRWNSAEFGVVSPAVFIPIAEDCGMIRGIGYWVLERAIADLAHWNRDRERLLAVSINVSVGQLADEVFASRLAELLAGYQVPADLVELEITESILMEGEYLEHCKALLCELKQLGVRIALDDFGTGYSSLSHLKELSLDTLKIDRSFVQALEEGAEAEVLRSIVEMSRRLGLSVVAEGVEQVQQEQILQQLGCDFFQGFYYARPKPIADILAAYPALKESA